MGDLNFHESMLTNREKTAIGKTNITLLVTCCCRVRNDLHEAHTKLKIVFTDGRSISVGAILLHGNGKEAHSLHSRD